MPGVEWTFDPDQEYEYGEQPSLVFKAKNTMTSFGASGSLASGSGTADFVIATGVLENGIFRNQDDVPTLTWWSAEYAGKTDKDSNGFLTDWVQMNQGSKGTTQTVSYRKAKWESSQQNSLPHLEFGTGDFLDMDSDISLRANEEWTIGIVTGPNTPSLYGCYLGSNNTSGTAVKTAYRWAGRRLKLRNEDGDEVLDQYSSSDESGYGGGPSSIHVLRCDGSNNISIRWNGHDIASGGVTANSQFNFSRIGHYQTTSTQQNSAFSLCELVVLEGHLTGTELTDFEGQLASKWGQTAKLKSDHPHYNSTATDGYTTPKISNSGLQTNATLSLGTTNASFNMKHSDLSADTYYHIYPVDVGTPGTITLKASWS